MGSRLHSARLSVIAIVGAMACAGCAADADRPLPASPTTARTQTAASLQRFAYQALKLGSDYNLVLYAPDQATADAAAKAAEAEIDRLELVFSDYRPDSEVSKLSLMTRDGPMKRPVPISQDLHVVLQMSALAHELTDGAFDVTVGPYVQLWKRSRRQHELPTPQRLEKTRPSVGWEHVSLDEPTTDDTGGLAVDGTPNLRLLATDMRLDFGGVATGYISDRVLGVLQDHGIHSALCDLSGDLAMGDPPPGRTGWTVAIQSLTKPNDIVETLELSNCGVSTSGDTYRFVEIDGVRYSHIVDVKTGLGLTDRVGVTAIGPDAMSADVLATVVSLLGPEHRLEIVERLSNSDIFRDAACRITTVSNDQVKVVQSDGYKRLPRP